MTDNPDSDRTRPQTVPHPSLSLNDDRRQIRRKHGPITMIPARAEPSCSKPNFDLAAVRVRQSALDTHCHFKLGGKV